MKEKGQGESAPFGCETAGEEVSLYVDGELSIGEQATLFAHLSTCEDCRLLLESVLQFRRMSRVESVAVPPAADEAFLRRLDRHKADRPPTARRGRSRSFRRSMAGVALCAMLFLGGLWMAGASHSDPPASLSSADAVRHAASADQVNQKAPPGRDRLYVFYPGLTVVASRIENVLSPEARSPGARPPNPLVSAPFATEPLPAEPLSPTPFAPDSVAPEPLAPEAL